MPKLTIPEVTVEVRNLDGWSLLPVGERRRLAEWARDGEYKTAALKMKRAMDRRATPGYPTTLRIPGSTPTAQRLRRWAQLAGLRVLGPY
jgi:hypothetical protein